MRPGDGICGDPPDIMAKTLCSAAYQEPAIAPGVLRLVGLESFSALALSALACRSALPVAAVFCANRSAAYTVTGILGAPSLGQLRQKSITHMDLRASSLPVRTGSNDAALAQD
jgi:hypothetical protein